MTDLRTPHRPSQRLVPRPDPRPLPERTLFDELVEDKTIAGRFEAFHAAHPEVYRQLVVLARQAVDNGHTRLSLKLLFEVLRWNHMVTKQPDDKPAEFVLNNVFTSHYARLIMRNEPDLDGMFELRKLKSA